MRQLMMLCFLSLLITACGDDDVNAPTPQATGTISAIRTNADNLVDHNWSLPQVNARLSYSGIVITASNSNTGEVLIFNLPNAGVGTYAGQSGDIDPVIDFIEPRFAPVRG